MENSNEPKTKSKTVQYQGLISKRGSKPLKFFFSLTSTSRNRGVVYGRSRHSIVYTCLLFSYGIRYSRVIEALWVVPLAYITTRLGRNSLGYILRIFFREKNKEGGLAVNP